MLNYVSNLVDSFLHTSWYVSMVLIKLRMNKNPDLEAALLALMFLKSLAYFNQNMQGLISFAMLWI